MGHPIAERVLAWIRSPDPQRFDEIALEVFAQQVKANAPYRHSVKRRGLRVDQVGTWSEIPPIPTAAFKILDLTCAPAERVFLTSGTTQGLGRRGRHGFPDLRVYEASLTAAFSASCLPDGARLPMVFLGPSPAERPDSSLAYMFGVLSRVFGTPEDRWCFWEGGVDVPGLTRALRAAEGQGTPVFLLGVTLGLLQFLEACEGAGARFRLPEGSRLMDTGGVKGQAPEIARRTLLDRCETVLGLNPAMCVNEYGMTELGSQFYEPCLRAALAGEVSTARLEGPPWVRTRVVDPETLREVEPGSIGLLIHYDLANCGSVLAVQTEDLAVRLSGGFRLVGRAPGAELRGCGLLVEDLVTPPCG